MKIDASKDMCMCGHSRAQHALYGGRCTIDKCECARFTWSHIKED